MINSRRGRSCFRFAIAIAAALFLLFAASCSNRPQAERFSGSGVLAPATLQTGDSPALWIALSDYQANGELARLDLASGNLRYGILPLAPDVHLVRDGDGLFLLQRNGGDSITRVRGSDAQIDASFPLQSMVNPQSATRDREGRIWLVSLDSNFVDVLSPDLRHLVHRIDLRRLHVGSADDWAELYDVAGLTNGQMAVVAARVDRPNWVPHVNAAIAFIDSSNFSVLRTMELPFANAVQIFAVDGGNGALVMGSGAQDPNIPLNGGFARLAEGARLSETTSLDSRPIHSAMDREGNFAWIAWDPSRRRSCVRFGNLTLVCETESGSDTGLGFFFYRIALGSGKVFVSYQKERNNELWVIDLQNRSISRIRLPMAVGSLVLGP